MKLKTLYVQAYLYTYTMYIRCDWVTPLVRRTVLRYSDCGVVWLVELLAVFLTRAENKYITVKICKGFQ